MKRAVNRPRRSRRAGERSGGWRRAVLFAGGALAAALGGLLAGVRVWAERPGLTRAAQRIELGREASPRAVAERLSPPLSALEEAALWLYWQTWRARASVAEGPHLVGPELSARELVEWLTRSNARPRQRVVIPEGFNRYQVAERLQKQLVCEASEFLRASGDEGAVAASGLGAKSSAEGYLFPATYDLYANSPADAVLARLVQEASRRYSAVIGRHSAAYQALATEFGWGVDELVVLASVIEKETGNAEERGHIAGVFLNRLRDPSFLPRRRLQSDPTAAYGCLVMPALASCSGFDGRVTPELLRDPQNPYNSYLNEGLPPGPIGSPGEAALEAILTAPETRDFFFVANPERPGTHTFSRTLAEHQQATRRR